MVSHYIKVFTPRGHQVQSTHKVSDATVVYNTVSVLEVKLWKVQMATPPVATQGVDKVASGRVWPFRNGRLTTARTPRHAGISVPD